MSRRSHTVIKILLNNYSHFTTNINRFKRGSVVRNNKTDTFQKSDPGKFDQEVYHRCLDTANSGFHGSLLEGEEVQLQHIPRRLYLVGP